MYAPARMFVYILISFIHKLNLKTNGIDSDNDI